MKSTELTKQITVMQTSLQDLQAEKAARATDLKNFDYTQGTAEEAAARLSNLRVKDEVLTQRIEVADKRIKQLNRDLSQARRNELADAVRNAEKDMAALREKVRPKLVALFDFDVEPSIRDVAPVFPDLDKLVDLTTDIRRRKFDIEMMEREIRQLDTTR